MQRKILPYLRCPKDRNTLERHNYSHDGKMIPADLLFCEHCNSAYDIYHGIPILRDSGHLTEEDVEKTKKWINWYKETLGTLSELMSMYLCGYDEVKEGRTPKQYKPIFDIFYTMLGTPNGLILDLCTGLGTRSQDTLAICDGKADLIAIDREIWPLKFQNRKLKRLGLSDKVSLVCADALHLPFADESLPLIQADVGFNATSDPLKAMQEAYRVLEKGGYGVTMLLCQPEEEYFETYLENLRTAGFVVEENEEIVNDRGAFLITKFKK